MKLELALLMVQDTTPGLEWPVEVCTQTEFERSVWLKGMESSYPSMLYLEGTQPVATLHVWPIPQHAYTLYVLPWTAHAPYEGWDHAISWPSGYQRAMTYNLAVEIAPQYGVEPSPTIQRIAEESKRALYPINAEVGRLSLWPGRRGGLGGLGLPQEFYTGRG